MPDNTIEFKLEKLAEHITNLRKELLQKPSNLDIYTFPDKGAGYELGGLTSRFIEFGPEDKEAYFVVLEGKVFIGDASLVDIAGAPFIEGRVLGVSSAGLLLNVRNIKGIWLNALAPSRIMVSIWTNR